MSNGFLTSESHKNSPEPSDKAESKSNYKNVAKIKVESGRYNMGNLLWEIKPAIESIVCEAINLDGGVQVSDGKKKNQLPPTIIIHLSRLD